MSAICEHATTKYRLSVQDLDFTKSLSRNSSTVHPIYVYSTFETEISTNVLINFPSRVLFCHFLLAIYDVPRPPLAGQRLLRSAEEPLQKRVDDISESFCHRRWRGDDDCTVTDLQHPVYQHLGRTSIYNQHRRAFGTHASFRGARLIWGNLCYHIYSIRYSINWTWILPTIPTCCSESRTGEFI